MLFSVLISYTFKIILPVLLKYDTFILVYYKIVFGKPAILRVVYIDVRN